MKIWVIGRGYPTPENKMWGSFELQQAKLLARNGHEVSYIALTLSFFDRKDPRGMRQFEEDNVTVYAYSHFYFPGKAGIYLEKFEDCCWRKLFDQANQNGMPDIIHVHYPSMISSINEIDAYRDKGVRIFVTEHWSRVLIHTLKKHELARLQYYATHADCVISVSEALQKAVQSYAKVTVPMKIIPNIISPTFFKLKPEASDDTFTFITVGRLVPLKQFDVIITEFLREFKDDERVKLRIIGSGSERSKLERIAQNDSRISFAGELPLADVAREIANANSLVSFSKYETFAAPVAEAWALGKPTIVSSESGIAAYGDDKLGVVASAKRPETLRKGMRHIYDCRTEYDPVQIREFARMHFSDKAIFAMLDELYSS